MSEFLQDRAYLERVHGVYLPETVREYMPDSWKQGVRYAMDAQPTLVTQANAGIPALYTTVIDPEVVRVVVTPVKAAQIYGETQRGSWTSDALGWPLLESTGYVAAYGDYNNNGIVGANAQWVFRQPFEYQTWVRWGKREVAKMGEAGLNYASELDIASAIVLNKAQNRFYLLGVAGIQNYGTLNDPNLPAAITPGTKTGGGTTWASTNDPNDIYNDFVRLFNRLNTQMAGNLTLDTPMTAVIPTNLQGSLLNTNNFGVKIRELLRENLPNLKMEFLPELAAGVGGFAAVNSMQLFVDTIDGRRTVTTAYTEKLRAHGTEVYSTYTQQKKTQGVWGAMWFYPFACATMTGI